MKRRESEASNNSRRLSLTSGGKESKVHNNNNNNNDDNNKNSTISVNNNKNSTISVNNNKNSTISVNNNKNSTISVNSNKNSTVSVNNKNSTISVNNIEKNDENYEQFVMKRKVGSSTGNTRRMSLIPSQMIRANEIKTPRRLLSNNNMSEGKNKHSHHNLMEENTEKHEFIPEDRKVDDDINSSIKKSLNVVDEKSEIRESKETMSNIGLDSGDKNRKGSIKSFSEISSSINREQRKNTVMKYCLYIILFIV